MDYFPIFADIRDLPCLVIGDGPMAGQKARLLERAGARVRRRIHFEPADGRKAFLIVADVEGDEAARIRDFGRRHRVFVNVVDKPEFCSFIVPAIVERGDLLVAVSTSGKSPALAGWIRRRLERFFGGEYQLLLRVLGRTRARIRELLPEYGDRKNFYYRLFDQGILDGIRTRGAEWGEERLWSALKEYSRCKPVQNE